MRINILRQKSPDTPPYFEAFVYEGTKDITVAGLIDHLNYNDDIVNEAGEKTERISWECSCMQGMCGGCAMVINERPALACETFLHDLKGEEITLRPLRKFPVIRDLIVDRSVIHENLKQTNMYIGEFQPKGKEDFRHQYDVAKCLKCGLCLEVCPNYADGKSFFGAMFANDSYLVSVRNREKAEHIRKTYSQYFGSTCSKALSCMSVCPMNIETIASIAKMNR